MKIVKTTLIILFTSLFCQSIFAKNKAANELSQLLGRFSTFQAQFSQTTYGDHDRLLQRSNGSVMLMRPGRFRWETNTPTHQIVITDGSTLWVYDVDLKQVTKQTIEKSAVNPARLLSGHVSKLLRKFSVKALPKKGEGRWFQLKPKQKDPQFQTASIEFVNQQLRSMKINTNMDQTNVFVFSKVKLNQPMSAALFQFKAPPGVDVLK